MNDTQRNTQNAALNYDLFSKKIFYKTVKYLKSAFLKPHYLISKSEKNGSRGIAPTLNCTHFLEIGFFVAGGGFYSYYIHKGNKSDKERKIVRKKFYSYKKI